MGPQLGAALTAALRETLEDPVAAIPSTFLSTNTTKSPPVSAEERDFLQLKQDVEFLKREFASRDPLTDFPPKFPAMHSRFPAVPRLVEIEFGDVQKRSADVAPRESDEDKRDA